MNGGSVARCQRSRTTFGISRPPHIKPRCSTPATCSSSVIVIVMAASSDGAEAREHRQNHAPDEERRKQPERRTGGDDDGKRASTPAVCEAERLRRRRALAEHGQPLYGEVRRRQP